MFLFFFWICIELILALSALQVLFSSIFCLFVLKQILTKEKTNFWKLAQSHVWAGRLDQNKFEQQCQLSLGPPVSKTNHPPSPFMPMMLLFLVLSICFLTDCPEKGSTLLHVWYNLAGVSFEMYVFATYKLRANCTSNLTECGPCFQVQRLQAPDLLCPYATVWRERRSNTKKKVVPHTVQTLNGADWPNQTPCIHVSLSSVSYGPSRKGDIKQEHTHTTQHNHLQVMHCAIYATDSSVLPKANLSWASCFPDCPFFALLFIWTAGHSLVCFFLSFFCFVCLILFFLRTTETLWTSFPNQACDPLRATVGYFWKIARESRKRLLISQCVCVCCDVLDWGEAGLAKRKRKKSKQSLSPSHTHTHTASHPHGPPCPTETCSPHSQQGSNGLDNWHNTK